MALEGEMVDAAPTAAERRMIMAKYIDREALVEWMKRIPLKDLSDGRGLCRVIFEDDFKRAIKKIPKGIIVDVAPVRHARWVDNHCTACGMIPMGDEMWKHLDLEPPLFERFMDYCPICGCRMDGGED